MNTLFDPDAPRTARLWQAFLARANGEAVAPLEPEDADGTAMIALYTPLLAERVTIGQLGQSLDGHIATESGASHYVTGPESLIHLHRLRALVDAVLVGWPTVVSDDPQLTVRHVPGPDPLRVALDPDGRLTGTERMFRPDGPGALRIIGEGVAPRDGMESIALPREPGGRIAPAAMLEALAARGCRRVLVEGGGRLVSGFLAAGALDRLHVAVAPLITGKGRRGLDLPGVAALGEALRPPARHHAMGADVLFDLDLAQAGSDAGGG